MKAKLLSFFCLIQGIFVWTQQSTGIIGKILDAVTKKPLSNVVVTIRNTDFSCITDPSGVFVFENIENGNQILQINNLNYLPQQLNVVLISGEILNLGIVPLEKNITTEHKLNFITPTENNLSIDNKESENITKLLQFDRDIFNQIAASDFGQAHFLIRGLENKYRINMINGDIMNKIYDRKTLWDNWNSLSDITANQEFTNGFSVSDYTFGSLLGIRRINTNASFYRPGTRISFSGANANYNGGISGEVASGINQKGWAFVISNSGKFSMKNYFEGTDYNSNSFFTAIEKKINNNHYLNFTFIYTRSSSGKKAANTEEVTLLAGKKYNPYWGWHNGVKRNSRKINIEDPIVMLSHRGKIGEKTILNTDLAYQYSSIGNSHLDFNSCNSPDPTYYKKLPNYYTTKYDPFGNHIGNSPKNTALANQARTFFMDNKQTDWDALYRINLENPDKESLVILCEDRTNDRIFTANATFNIQLSDHVLINSGGTFRKLISDNFQSVLDLLGGTHYKNTTPFFRDNRSQNDLNNPNRKVFTRNRFGYNYILKANTTTVFTQLKFSHKNANFYSAVNYSRSEYQREGHYRNGLYPDNSFGKGAKIFFNNYGIKGGITYKVRARHLLDFNGLYMTLSPSLKNSYLNIRLNNNIVNNLKNESIINIDGSYIIRYYKLKTRLTAYFLEIKNITKTNLFFAERINIPGEESKLTNKNDNVFASEIIKGIKKKNMGVELGVKYHISKTIQTTIVAAYGQYIYGNNPTINLNIDTNQSTVDFGRSTMKNYKQAGMPQQAYALGFEYKDSKRLRIGININYLANSYTAISPLLRTNHFFLNPKDPQGLPFDNITKEKVRTLLKQEKLDPMTFINLTVGKSWKIGKKTIYLFVRINNLFDKIYKTKGFEQVRNANFKELSQDLTGPNRTLGSKYLYNYGRLYYVNIHLNL